MWQMADAKWPRQAARSARMGEAWMPQGTARSMRRLSSPCMLTASYAAADYTRSVPHVLPPSHPNPPAYLHGRRWSPNHMMFEEWASAAGIAPEVAAASTAAAASQARSQLSVVSRWSPVRMLFEDWAAAAGDGSTREGLSPLPPPGG